MVSTNLDFKSGNSSIVLNNGKIDTSYLMNNNYSIYIEVLKINNTPLTSSIIKIEKEL